MNLYACWSRNGSVIMSLAPGYTYNAQGIRTSRTIGLITTHYLLDGGNVIGEVTGDETVTYVRGVNLIYGRARYYLYNAHGDVVQLTNTNGELTRNYNYDAFGNERQPSEDDTNPFRYCGEYYDTETGLYYLRARYYDPLIGRFTQEDTHWNTANMIYGDNPQKINEREDKLGLKTYSYAPELLSILQAGNLYLYAICNPLCYIDPGGEVAIPGEVLGKDAWLKLAEMAFDLSLHVFAVVGSIIGIIFGVYSGVGVFAVIPLLYTAAIEFARAIYDTVVLVQAMYNTIKYGGFTYTDYVLTGYEWLDWLLPGAIGAIGRPN